MSDLYYALQFHRCIFLFGYLCIGSRQKEASETIIIIKLPQAVNSRWTCNHKALFWFTDYLPLSHQGAYLPMSWNIAKQPFLSKTPHTFSVLSHSHIHSQGWWNSHQDLGFISKDTSTYSQRAGDQTSDLPISGQPALPLEPQPTHGLKHPRLRFWKGLNAPVSARHKCDVYFSNLNYSFGTLKLPCGLKCVRERIIFSEVWMRHGHKTEVWKLELWKDNMF